MHPGELLKEEVVDLLTGFHGREQQMRRFHALLATALYQIHSPLQGLLALDCKLVDVHILLFSFRFCFQCLLLFLQKLRQNGFSRQFVLPRSDFSRTFAY